MLEVKNGWIYNSFYPELKIRYKKKKLYCISSYNRYEISITHMRKYINNGDIWIKTGIGISEPTLQVIKPIFKFFGFDYCWPDYDNERKRQSYITRLLNLLQKYEEYEGQETHAVQEVVDAQLEENETVHGANDIAQDIPDAPEREEAEGEEETEENSDGNLNGNLDEFNIEAEINACFGVGVTEVKKRCDTIADVEEGNGLAVSRELRKLFEKLAFERAPYGRTDELEYWDGRKLVLSKVNPNKLMCAKSGKEKDMGIYFFLDDSGSMYPYAKMFKGLLEASKHVVNTYVGSEAHPEKAVDGSYCTDYVHSFFEQLKKWIDTVKPAPGSVLIFWGDTCDMNIRGDERKVRRLLRPYRVYWLGTYKEYNYRGWEQRYLPAAGFKVVSPVTNLKELRRAIKKIR